MSVIHPEEDRLEEYALGRLPEKDTAELEEHLLACTLCQSRLVELDDFVIAFRAAALEMGTRKAPLWSPQRWRLGWAGLGLATAAALLVLVFTFGRSGTPQLPATVVTVKALRGAEVGALVPAARPLILVIPLPAADFSGSYSVQVLSRDGRIVVDRRAEAPDGKLRVPVEGLDRGSYWLRVYSLAGPGKLLEESSLRAQ